MNKKQKYYLQKLNLLYQCWIKNKTGKTIKDYNLALLFMNEKEEYEYPNILEEDGTT